MSTFTSERSYLQLLRNLLPKTDRKAAVDSIQEATFPGQNAWEVYGISLFVFVFHVCLAGDWLGSVWLAFPAGLVLLHFTSLLSGVLGDQFQKHISKQEAQAYIWPQRFHWGILTVMAWIAITTPFLVTAWLAWPFVIVLCANLCAWSRFFLAALLHLIVGWMWYQHGWQVGFPILFALHATILFGALHPHSQMFGSLVRRFRTDSKKVWLTIDDGPGEDTAAILDLLDEHKAKATFFLIGERAEARPDDVQAISARGHQIGNHTFTHPARTFWMALPRSIKREITRTQEVLERLTGIRPLLFRSPVGFKSPMLHPILANTNLKLIGWSARGFDGVGSDIDEALRRLQGNIRPGAIILVHQGRPMNLPLLSALLAWLDAEGFRCAVPNLFENESARLS